MKIWVLWWIWPKSTILFYDLLINKFQKYSNIKWNEWYPHILINSIPAPELNYNNQNISHYLNWIKLLEKNNVNFIVMVCNTIHLFYEFLQNNVSVQILDLKNLVKNYLLSKNLYKIWVIWTSLTINKWLYNFENIEIIYPEAKNLIIIDEIILNRNLWKSWKKDIMNIINITYKLLDNNVQCIFLWCTELVSILQNVNFHKISSIDILVDWTYNKIIESSC